MVAACLDAPTFVLDESTMSASPTTPVSGEGDDAMVRVPATTFATQGTLTPTAPGRENDEDKKGHGKDGGGKPPPDEPDEPDAAAPPPPSGSTTSVPAFWIDVHEVTARAYAACVAEGECSAAGTQRECTVGAGPALDDHPANCVSVDQARDALGHEPPDRGIFARLTRETTAQTFTGDGVVAGSICRDQGTYLPQGGC